VPWPFSGPPLKVTPRSTTSPPRPSACTRSPGGREEARTAGACEVCLTCLDQEGEYGAPLQAEGLRDGHDPLGEEASAFALRARGRGGSPSPPGHFGPCSGTERGTGGRRARGTRPRAWPAPRAAGCRRPGHRRLGDAKAVVLVNASLLRRHGDRFTALWPRSHP
jgi:hypothetical protein